MACLLALLVMDAPLRSSDAVVAPHLPETPFDYEGTVLPEHFLANYFPGAMQEGAAAHHDNMPPDNPVTNAGATLGRVLFYDKKLSANGTVSCSTCHIQEHGFADPARLSRGFAGGFTKRHSMGLANARFNRSGKFFWDERASTLEEQVLMPFQDPVEMGLTLQRLVETVREQPYYSRLFEAAFGSGTVNSDRLARALAQFVRSLVSADSKYDRGRRQVQSPTADFPNFSDLENHGKRIFMTNGGVERTPCIICHQSEAFVGSTPRGRNSSITGATNNGLDAVSVDDLGVAESTMNSADTGKFRVPSLRNIGVTAPYMHDGRLRTLEAVVDHYSTGIQDHPQLDGSLRQQRRGPERYNFATDEKTALIAFLHTLTDEGFLTEEKSSDPFYDPELPQITKVVNSATGGELIGGQTWVSIFGRNLALETASWTDSPLADARLPVQLGGTSVIIDRELAYVHSVSPRRINVLLPTLTAERDASIQVTVGGNISGSVGAESAPVAPGLFVFDRDGSPGIGDISTLPAAIFRSSASQSPYVMALHEDGTRVAAEGMFVGEPTRPASPGDIITLYGTGFGPTSPEAVDGHSIGTPLTLAGHTAVLIGDVAAGVAFVGLVAPGLYQLNVVVPSVASGTVPVAVEVGGVRSQEFPLLTVRQ